MTDPNAIVEALRERVAELEGALHLLFAYMDDGWLVRDTIKDGEPDWAIKQLQYVRGLQKANAVLSATPAEALERARAVARVVKAAYFFMEDGVAEDSPDLNKVAWQALDSALAQLDALGEEAG